MPPPITGVPFEKVRMDLVSPLPKSAQDHEYILVIMDYATHYHEAVSLWKATSKNIAWELVLMFSCIDLPSDLLTDQGTPIISKLMANVSVVTGEPDPHLSIPSTD